MDEQEKTRPGPVVRRARRKLPTARELSLQLWKGVMAAVDLLADADPGVRLKAVHSLSAVGGQYAKSLEVGELERRLEALEAALSTQPGPEVRS